MPAIIKIGSWRFFFFSREGQKPAHVHVEAQGCEKFWLDNVQLASSYAHTGVHYR